MRIFVSACLMGIFCRYDGREKENAASVGPRRKASAGAILSGNLRRITHSPGAFGDFSGARAHKKRKRRDGGIRKGRGGGGAGVPDAEVRLRHFAGQKPFLRRGQRA